jgi:hypothetical protein
MDNFQYYDLNIPVLRFSKIIRFRLFNSGAEFAAKINKKILINAKFKRPISVSEIYGNELSNQMIVLQEEDISFQF